ncbi:hypothetical protein Tco_1274274 [Tanacetum coccineum]
MFHNVDQLRLQLKRENLLEVNPKTCLDALRTLFKEFFASKGRDLLENLETLEAVIHRAIITYGRLQLQSQEVQINPVQAVDDRLIVSKTNGIESKNTNALSKLVNETQLQQHESLVTESTTLEVNLNTDVKALDAGSVITESSGTKSDKHDTSSSLGTYITHAINVDIRPVNDQVPVAEVQLTAQHNVLANEQQHIKQSEPIYDTYLLEKVDSNTTPGSTNMCHKGGEVDQDAKQYQAKSPLLKAEFLKTNDMDAPEFCEFLEINDLKAQLQAKTILICNLKNQIKSVKEASNEAKVKHEIDVLETINIELESSMAKLLVENEKLNKENEHLKQTYKELYDSIKKTRIQTKNHNDSLIAQVNSKTDENADLKAQIQENVFVNVALKNELRKLKGNITSHYLPKVQEYVLAKPHHVIAPGSSRNSQEEPYGSNDMVNSRAKVQSPKTRNNNKPVEPNNHTQKPGRQIAIGQRFSPKKSSAVHGKPNTPRSCLRWKPAGRIFKIAGLRWIPTRKMFTDNTTKVDSEPPNSLNDDITNPYECDQTLNVSAGLAPQRKERCTIQCTLSLEEEKSSYLQAVLSTTSISLKLTLGYISLRLVQNLVSSTPYVPPSKKDYEILFQPLFDEYFNPPPCAISLDPVAIVAQELLIQSVQLRQLPLIKMYHLLVLH